MLEAGVDPFHVGRVLNHVSTTNASLTTRNYGHRVEKERALTTWTRVLLEEQRTGEDGPEDGPDARTIGESPLRIANQPTQTHRRQILRPCPR